VKTVTSPRVLTQLDLMSCDNSRHCSLHCEKHVAKILSFQ